MAWTPFFFLFSFFFFLFCFLFAALSIGCIPLTCVSVSHWERTLEASFFFPFTTLTVQVWRSHMKRLSKHSRLHTNDVITSSYMITFIDDVRTDSQCQHTMFAYRDAWVENCCYILSGGPSLCQGCKN
jgi:hypothetical protein